MLPSAPAWVVGRWWSVRALRMEVTFLHVTDEVVQELTSVPSLVLVPATSCPAELL